MEHTTLTWKTRVALSGVLLSAAWLAQAADNQRPRAPISDLTVDDATPKRKPAEVKLEEESRAVPAPATSQRKSDPAPAPPAVESEPERPAPAARVKRSADHAVPPPPEVKLEEEPLRTPEIGQTRPLEPPEGADVRLIQRGDTKIEEYRVKGKLVMSKVTPKHGVPYYIQYRGTDRPPQSDRVEPDLNVPMWRIGNF